MPPPHPHHLHVSLDEKRSYQQVGGNRHIFIHKLLRIRHFRPHLGNFQEHACFSPTSEHVSTAIRRKSDRITRIQFKKTHSFQRQKSAVSLLQQATCRHTELWPHPCVAALVLSNGARGQTLWPGQRVRHRDDVTGHHRTPSYTACSPTGAGGW